MDTPDVLLVNDNSLEISVLWDYLDLQGYRVRAAHSAREAWDFYRVHGARCVITDCCTPDPLLLRYGYGLLCEHPGLSGLELAARVRQTHPSPPVIVLSVDPPKEAAAVSDVVLRKPCSLTVLTDALGRVGVHPRRDVAATGLAAAPLALQSR